MHGVKFSYAKKVYSEEEERVARTRALFAQRGRLQARKFAEAEKRPKQTKGSRKVHEDLLPLQGKKIVTNKKVDDTCVAPSLEKRHVVHRKDVAPVLEDKPVVAAPPVPGVGEVVRRIMYTPNRFLSHLTKQDECFLHNLGGRYGVSIVVGTPQTKIYIQGPKANVQACYACVKVLLVKWHQREAAKQ